jgi:hypothetical protein
MAPNKSSLIVTLVCLGAMVAACAGSPTSTPSAASYDGQWSGPTSQGTTLSFVVSNDRLSGLTFGYSLNGCSGNKTGDKSVAIMRNSTNTGESNVLVVYLAGQQPADADYLFLGGRFTSSTTAEGTVVYHSCVDASRSTGDGFSWTATKR